MYVKWNFFKFLIDGNGQVVEVYDHQSSPLMLTDDIEKLLAAPRSGGQKLVTE
jgi:glutathione peroxidase